MPRMAIMGGASVPAWGNRAFHTKPELRAIGRTGRHDGSQISLAQSRLSRPFRNGCQSMPRPSGWTPVPIRPENRSLGQPRSGFVCLLSARLPGSKVFYISQMLSR